ncbi:hypothetical protein [Secundilactobacillus kimchicus]|uniref:hypothetical protein n=1 Tax=Secundilactobacillus kimchicus TaxID=528209 RepID=UPI000B2259A6
MIALTNETAARTDADERTAMAASFVRSSAYELAFWQMAWIVRAGKRVKLRYCKAKLNITFSDHLV